MNLAHAYEAEFSSLTEKTPNANGEFEPDTLPNNQYQGYILYEKLIPIGFCITDVSQEPHDIAEFYIIPVKRKCNYGYELAKYVFTKYPGQWQVRQIEGAHVATAFWRKVITAITNDNYQEAIVDDPSWGIVTRQSFTIPK